MFCSKCGNILPEHAKYCTSCGAKVEKHATAVNAVPQFEHHQPVQTPGFIEAVDLFFSNCFRLSGRSRRSEFWWVQLLLIAVSSVLDKHLPVYGVYWGIIVLIPSFSLRVRRLHDVGKSGFYLLWNILPVIGWIMVLIQYLKPSQKGDNKYGEDPHLCC